ncbi:MAG: hypothetical protein KH366_13195 [Clostridiaceae bacterium]|nr:hypothetical protein [Clostridiaceae bacterium]
MLPITLSKLEILLTPLLNVDERSRFIDVFKHYKKNKWIYPGALQRTSRIPIEKVYEVLNLLEEEQIVKSYFEIICSECKKTTAQVYHSIDEIPENYMCENCGYLGHALDNVILIFKIVKDE